MVINEIILQPVGKRAVATTVRTGMWKTSHWRESNWRMVTCSKLTTSLPWRKVHPLLLHLEAAFPCQIQATQENSYCLANVVKDIPSRSPVTPKRCSLWSLVFGELPSSACGRCCAVLFHLGRWLPAAHSPWRWLRGCGQKLAEGSPGGIGGPGCRPAVLSTASPPRSCRWCGGRRGLAPLGAGVSGRDPGWSWPAEPGVPSPRAAPPRPPPLAAGGWGRGGLSARRPAAWARESHSPETKRRIWEECRSQFFAGKLGDTVSSWTVCAQKGRLGVRASLCRGHRMLPVHEASVTRSETCRKASHQVSVTPVQTFKKWNQRRSSSWKLGDPLF